MNITETCETQINHLIQHAERSITLKQFATGQIVIGGGWAAETGGATPFRQWFPPRCWGTWPWRRGLCRR